MAQTLAQTVAPELTNVSLANLSTFKTEYDKTINAKIEAKTARVFSANKTALDKADTAVIEEYFVAHTGITLRTGDVFLINTLVDGKVYEQSSYCYNENQWVAITGNVDASKVVLRENIKMAGNYTQVGNYTKSLNGTVDIPAKGMTVKELFSNIFTKTEQPKITANPAVSGFALTGARAVEAGTKVATANFGTATLSAGAYTYGPATGITATSYVVDRVAEPASFNKAGVANAASGTDNNGGAGFIIGDGAEANVVTSLRYKVKVAHGEGAVAKDNVGGQSNPVVKIAAGTKEQLTGAYTAYRSFFYGATKEKPALNSAYVRSLTNSNCAYSARTLTINVPVGATRVAIACIAGKTGVTKVVNETALNANVTDTFKKSTVSVQGAEGYTAKDYNVWVFEPALPYGQAAVLKVTLG